MQKSSLNLLKFEVRSDKSSITSSQSLMIMAYQFYLIELVRMKMEIIKCFGQLKQIETNLEIQQALLLQRMKVKTIL